MTAQRLADSLARVEFTVQFSRGTKGRRRAREASDPGKAPGRVPKITRLLVLGHHFERLVREGKVKDYTEIARLTGLTRARITQIVNLTLLAPEIHEALLSLPQDSRIMERSLRSLISHSDWRSQRGLWGSLGGGLAHR